MKKSLGDVKYRLALYKALKDLHSGSFRSEEVWSNVLQLIRLIPRHSVETIWELAKPPREFNLPRGSSR